jgi:type IV secretory pathway VirB3-like protein
MALREKKKAQKLQRLREKESIFQFAFWGGWVYDPTKLSRREQGREGANEIQG